ncbi:hypothetical protein [Streptomyces goshikiensis]|uniref:hypothetical protein n=1 Tax=Streptomyces goshikiensis TaxID=1942 RepID=UPI0036A601C8
MRPHPDTTPALLIDPSPPSGTEHRALLLAGTPATDMRPGDRRDRTERITHADACHVAGMGDFTALTAPSNAAGTRILERRKEPFPPGGKRPAESVGTPDFAALFALRDRPRTGGQRHSEELRQLTPRTADLLHTALAVLADQAYDDVQDLADRFLYGFAPAAAEVFDRLPPCTWQTSHRWRRRMARAFDDLAGDLVQGLPPTPSCPAEEMALHLAVEDVPGHLIDLWEEDEHHSLPHHQGDYDYSHLPFRNLYDPFSGVGEVHRPAIWFTPFDGRLARDPRRGFRR